MERVKHLLLNEGRVESPVTIMNSVSDEMISAGMQAFYAFSHLDQSQQLRHAFVAMLRERLIPA